MTPSGWLTLILSVGCTNLVFLWCICKILRTPKETEKLHGFDSHTPDEEAS